jgi:hypothetical protein
MGWFGMSRSAVCSVIGHIPGSLSPAFAPDPHLILDEKRIHLAEQDEVKKIWTKAHAEEFH